MIVSAFSPIEPEVDLHAPPRKLRLFYHDIDRLGSESVPAIDANALKLVRYPDPRLRRRCAPVEEFDAELAAVARRMIEVMHGEDGVGLAGPQVGFEKRIFVCNLTGDSKNALVLVNPVLVELEGAVEGDEGCLSIPDVNVKIRRAARCTVKAQDLEGNDVSYSAADLTARCWQHECDHLDGRLIIDYMSEADRIANRRALKSLEADFKRDSKRR